MGSTPRAHLAYGYDLGNPGDFKAAERNENGGSNLPWLEPYASVWSFLERAERRLTAPGVVVRTSGSEGGYGLMLVADGSDRSVDWDEAMVLDVTELDGRPGYAGWDLALSDALAALGITPTQDGPRWLVYPSYG